MGVPFEGGDFNDHPQVVSSAGLLAPAPHPIHSRVGDPCQALCTCDPVGMTLGLTGCVDNTAVLGWRSLS